MKRKDFLLLTFLLTQTAPVWGMQAPEFEIEEFMRPAQGNPRARLRITPNNGTPPFSEFFYLENVQHLEFEPSLPNDINEFEPTDNILQNCGYVREKVRFMFDYNGDPQQVELCLPNRYPLRGQWVFQEDRDNTQNRALLKLKALINQQWVSVYERALDIEHECLHSDPEIPGLCYFNGNMVSKARTKRQQWRNPRNGQTYHRTLIINQEGKFPNHEGHEIVYAEPFSLGEGPILPPEAYIGGYRFVQDLADHQCIADRQPGRLIYSDGTDVYLPKVTQELWEKEGERMGFFIASYKQEARIKFIHEALIPNGGLPKGLYHLLSVRDQENGRNEKWRKLGEARNIIEITIPTCISSIPGIGSLAPREVPQDGNTTFQVLEMQKAIQTIIRTTEENANLYPNVRNAVILLGSTGSGKSTLIQGLAGDLVARQNAMRDFCLHASEPLPGFSIGHGFNSETKIPGFWYDVDNERLVIDCQGFGDSEGNIADIVNAFSIKKLFPNSAVKVVLVAEESDIKFGRAALFIKLLNQITAFYEDQEQLKQSLSVVFTKATADAFGRIRSIAGGLNSDHRLLSEPAKALLQFLNHSENRNHVLSFPIPTAEGAYTFKRREFLDCIASTSYIASPKVKISVSAEARECVEELAKSLNLYLIDYIKLEESQRIITHCRKKIDSHLTTLIDLRNYFTNLVEKLQQIAIETPEAFINGLNVIFNNDVDIEDIKRTVQIMDLLKTIKEKITYNVEGWKTALEGTITKIKILTGLPQKAYNDDNKILCLTGPLVSTSDVNAALLQHPNATCIHTYSLNTLFIDEDINAPSKSFGMVSPCIKLINGPKIINLSGIAGAHGDSGVDGEGTSAKPGLPGANGGHFYANAFEFTGLNHLAVHTHGGLGGNGGKGGNGKNGANGADGDVEKITKTAPYHKVTWKLDVSDQDDRGIYHFFNDEGKDGTAGNHGGQGGQGGKGGLAGLSLIDGSVWNPASHHGAEGADGECGIGGQGGVHGKHCTGKIVKNVTTTNNVNGDTEQKRDILEIQPAHEPRTPERAASGLPAVELVSSQGPAEQQNLNAQVILKDYSDYYTQEAKTLTASPFIKVFSIETNENARNEKIAAQKAATQERSENESAQKAALRERKRLAQVAEAEKTERENQQKASDSTAEREKREASKATALEALRTEENETNALVRQRIAEKEAKRLAAEEAARIEQERVAEAARKDQEAKRIAEEKQAAFLKKQHEDDQKKLAEATAKLKALQIEIEEKPIIITSPTPLIITNDPPKETAPTVSPKVEEWEIISAKEYRELKKRRSKNIKVVFGEQIGVRYLHRRGHVIDYDHYLKRQRKGKGVSMQIIRQKTYYRIKK